MRSIACISLVLTLTTLTGCSRTGAFCETSEKGCCSEGEVEDEDGECVAEDEVDENGEYAFSATVFEADGFEGLFLRVAVNAANATWNGEARIEGGEAILAIPASVLAGASEYSVHTWIDVDGDGVAGPDDASWLSTFDARDGRTDISVDARDAYRF